MRIDDGLSFLQSENRLKEFCSVDSRSNVHVEWNISGFLMLGSNLITVFPKNYLIPENLPLKKRAAVSLLRTFIRYKNENGLTADEHRLLGDSHSFCGRLESAYAILKDYADNGYLVRKIETLEYTHAGRINWNRTINSILPVVSNGRPVYVETINNRSISDSNNVVRMIHKYVVSEAAEIWGWLFDIDPKEKTQLKISFTDAIKLLKKELRFTFTHREIAVIKLMIAFLENSSDEGSGETVSLFCTDHFHTIWEKICGVIFHNQYNFLCQYVPTPEWVNAPRKYRITQIPDILVKDEKQKIFYILDAKYYNCYTNMPGWHDLVKQFFYYYTIRENFPNAKQYTFRNILLLPGNITNHVAPAGKAVLKEITGLGEIEAVLINCAEAVECYGSYNTVNFLEYLDF